MGPVLGPVVGGFLGMSAGWRWVDDFLSAFTGLLWLMMACFILETYAPVLLRRRAERLSNMTGKVHRMKLEVDQEKKISLKQVFLRSLFRPWILLLQEPIVLILSVYIAIIYGALFMMFASFPIVFQEGRGWNQGIGGLGFMGIMVGKLIATAYTVPDNMRSLRDMDRHGGFAPPESRLPPVMLSAVCIPVGLFWFAWTNSPSIHWMASIAAGVPYLIDAYTIFAASVLAANTILRSIFAAVFPLFMTYMYDSLGIHWGSSIPAFLTVLCMPFPFLFYRHGKAVQERCKYAAQSEAFIQKIMQDTNGDVVRCG